MDFIDLKQFIHQIDQINTISGGKSETFVNIDQNNDHILIKVTTPSLSDDNYNVVVNKDKLLIYSLIQNSEEDNPLAIPFFNRAFDIPYFVDASAIEAEVSEGELRVIMPVKNQQSIQPRKIDIRHNS